MSDLADMTVFNEAPHKSQGESNDKGRTGS